MLLFHNIDIIAKKSFSFPCKFSKYPLYEFVEYINSE